MVTHRMHPRQARPTHPANLTPRENILARSDAHGAHVLQDYLEALFQGAESAAEARQRTLLFSFAELRFRVTGGAKCPMCRTHVRHVVPVNARRADGTSVTYDCLCQRCLQAELALAEEVVMSIGEATVRYIRQGDAQPEQRTWARQASAAAND